MTWARGHTSVRWAHGGLVVRHRDQVLLLDAPADVARGLGDDVAHLRVVAMSSGRIAAVGGLVPLLHAAAVHGPADRPLTIIHGAFDERTPTLVDAWLRGWSLPRPVQLDAVTPGEPVQEPPFMIESMRVRRGETDGRLVVPAEGMALRVTTEDGRIAWIPGACAQPGLSRLCDGIDLAVVEVGRVSWPPAKEPWRLGLEDAVRIGAAAAELWVVGDDGRRLTHGAAQA